MTDPDASASGLARSSSTSATRRMLSSSSSRPVLAFAETLLKIVSPPQSSGWRSRFASSPLTLSTFAASRSILLTATMIGTSAARAWSIASTVCGMTPSSAATTTTTMSVTSAPRARIAVNAAWPGVSMKRDRLLARVHLVGADVLGDATGLSGDHLGLADRVEERGLSVVDVAHDRHDRRAVLKVLVGVLEDDLLGLLLGCGDHLDLAVEGLGDDDHRLVGKRLRERRHLAERHERLDDLGAGEPERLGDFLDAWRPTGS